MLDKLVTEQGTKRLRAEPELAAETQLRSGEVRAVLNALAAAALARPLDTRHGVWELSHDFVAAAMVRYLGRRRRDALRRAASYAAPTLLAMTLIGLASILVWEREAFRETRVQLAELGYLLISPA